MNPKIQDKKRYVRVSFGGASFIDTNEAVQAFLAVDEEPERYSITDVWMTQAEFQALPEFIGF